MLDRVAVFIIVGAAIGGLVAGGLGSPARNEVPTASSPGYRVVYEVEERTVGKATQATWVLEVRRPYDARLETRARRPPGGDVVTGQVTNRDFLWQLDRDGALRFGVRRSPGIPVRDGSYAALTEAADRGVIESHGGGSYVGRECTWFAYRDPFPQFLRQPNRDSRVEACVDGAGIMLREVWTIGGRGVRSIEAVEVVDSAPPSSRFLIGKDPSKVEVLQPEAEKLLRSQFAVSEGGERDPSVGFRAPRGWKRDRRSVVATGLGTSTATQALVETYLRDGELAVVERSVDKSHKPTWSGTEGDRVDAGPIGNGRMVFFPDHIEVRVSGSYGYARVTAVTFESVLAFARRLSD